MLTIKFLIFYFCLNLNFILNIESKNINNFSNTGNTNTENITNNDKKTQLLKMKGCILLARTRMLDDKVNKII